MNLKICGIGILGILGMLAATVALGQTTILFDDFEGVTPPQPGSILPDATKWDPSQSTGGIGNNIGVEFGLGENSPNAMFIKRAIADGNRLGQVKALFAPITSGIVEISLSYTEAAPNPSILNFMFNFNGTDTLVMESQTAWNLETGEPGGPVILHWNAAGSGHMPFKAAGSGDFLVYNGGAGGREWNHVKYTINLDNDTVVADLNEVVSDPISVDFGAAGLTNFWFRGVGEGQAAIVDNVMITATAAAVANANFDGVNGVDGKDFLIWQRGAGLGPGATLAQGDANGDGAVNAADLAVWQTQFGTSALAAVSLVPEPTALFTSLVGCCLALRRPWTRRTLRE